MTSKVMQIESMIQRKLFPALLVATLMACTGNRKEAEKLLQSIPEEETAAPDSAEMLEATDTLELDDEVRQGEVPSTMDEVFDDFIFTFDQSSRMQRERILFPLKVTEADGSVHYIPQRNWQHRYLFMQQDFCTVLWTSRSQMEAEPSAELQQAEVQQIYLHSRQVNEFIFLRDSLGRWFLTEERIKQFDQSGLAPFLLFYTHFATDSIFQRHHVHPQLRYVWTDENAEETISGTIDIDQWFEFRPDLPQDVLTNIHTTQQYDDPHRMILQMRALRAGIENVLTFRRENNEWRLTGFEN